MNKQMAADVQAGLTSSPKRLSSKYFYDERGSLLFSQIMQLPEYYLTDAEMEIFQEKSDELISSLGLSADRYFELVELGAGDGYKTTELVRHLEEGSHQYSYLPIDISQKALDQLQLSVGSILSSDRISPQCGDYFERLEGLRDTAHPKVILFLGSNIGNMTDDQAYSFLARLSDSMAIGDHLVLGVDLKKSADIILPAYDDSQGVTREFNLNLLRRINRELDADFDISLYDHAPAYDEELGIASSAIRSLTRQEVHIGAIDLSVKLSAGELIHTEISRKYDDAILSQLTRDSGLEVVGRVMDSRSYFADYILTKRY